jgi:dihydroorotate dehydrogenase
MLSSLFDLARPALFVLDPEQAHEIVLKSLELGIYPRPGIPDDESLACNLGPLQLPNPVGIAAGFDKDARVPDAILGLGCGFAEVGTVTPLPQAGNTRPRIFRLVNDRGVINRLGFNNAGHGAALARLQRRDRKGVIGVNVGANKDAADLSSDYVAGLEAFYDVASYFTINVSSPNTPGLRDLQAPEALARLLDRVMVARGRCLEQGAAYRPIVVKLAPDLAEADLPAICEQLVSRRVDAIAVSNTTVTRPRLVDAALGQETGGLSGRPLFQRSTVMLGRVFMLVEGRIPLIGIGGIDSGAAAVSKIEAGASLVQLYTGLIYEGPDLIARIKAHLVQHARTLGVKRIAEATGRRAAEWAKMPLEG